MLDITSASILRVWFVYGRGGFTRLFLLGNYGWQNPPLRAHYTINHAHCPITNSQYGRGGFTRLFVLGNYGW